METDGKISRSSGRLAIIVIILATLSLLPDDKISTIGESINWVIDKVSPYRLIIYYLIVTVCCFFIVKNKPKSFFYVPLICNAPTIISAFWIDFWKDSIWIIAVSGLALSIIASIIGARKGRKVAISDNP